MNRLLVFVASLGAAAGLVAAGCTQAAPAPTPAPAKAPAAPAAPTAAPAAPTAAPAPAAPTKAPEPTKAAPQPTAAPAVKKVDFPQKGKSISIIIPYPAGGTVYVAAQVLAPFVEKELGAPVQVVAKPGAGSQVGLTEVALAKPDGYTLGMAIIPSSLGVYLDPDRKAVFNGKSFEYVSAFVYEPMVIGVKGDSPHKGMKDLVEAAKVKPETVKIGDSGPMTVSHMQILTLQRAAGARFAIVHFEGDPPGMAALQGGHIDAFSGSPGSWVSGFKSGQLRPLGVGSKVESPFFPGVKPFRDQGYNVISDTIRGLITPAGTPKEIVQILDQAVKKAMDNPEFKKKADEGGVGLGYLNSADFQARWLEAEKELVPLVEEARAEMKK